MEIHYGRTPMICPHCHEEIRDGALKCRYCKKLLGDVPSVRRHTWVCGLSSFLLGLIAAFFAGADLYSMQHPEISCTTPSEGHMLMFAVFFPSALISVILGVIAVKNRYRLRWVGIFGLLLSMWGGYMFWNASVLLSCL